MFIQIENALNPHTPPEIETLQTTISNTRFTIQIHHIGTLSHDKTEYQQMYHQLITLLGFNIIRATEIHHTMSGTTIQHIPSHNYITTINHILVIIHLHYNPTQTTPNISHSLYITNLRNCQLLCS